MEGKQTISITEELIFYRANAVWKNQKVTKRNKLMAYITIFFLIFLLIEIFYNLCFRHIIKMWPIIFSMLYMVLIWWFLCGIKQREFHKLKKQMEKTSYPIERHIYFNEDILEVTGENYVVKKSWNNIDYVCNTRDYWFIGHELLIIDKHKLSVEQLEFFENKLKGVENKF